MQIIDGELVRSELTKNAKGGSEIIMERLYNSFPKETFKGYQIINSRIDGELREDLCRVLILHDLPDDPASHHLGNDGWNKFQKLVFVSNWQMQQYISYYRIPWDRCIVIQNSIVPIDNKDKPNQPIRLAYWSTPHRGLDLLVPVFEKLLEKHSDIILDVYSSFNLYGWPERDKEFKELFDRCEANPSINYFGSVSNKVIRERIKAVNILAYPSTWPETSCIVLMEAMSAGVACVHSNYAALSETAANWTFMYQYADDKRTHANRFYGVLDTIIENYNDPSIQARIQGAKQYADIFYSWDKRKNEWAAFLNSDIKNHPKSFEKSYITFKTS